MGILRADRVSGLGGANAIVGSTRFSSGGSGGNSKTVTFFKDSSIAPGTSDFCAEAWVYFNFVDNTNNTQLFANLNGNFGVSNANCWAVIRIGANNQFYGWSGSGWVSFGAGAPTVNTWHYIQLVRASNVQTLYFDGSALGSTVTNSNDLTHDEIGLGARDDGSEGLDGFISNFRLTIGSSAAALAGIVPSAASRVLSTDTKLLCCNDPGNVNNEDAQGIPTSTTSDNDVQMIQGFASRFVPDKGEDHGTTFADNTKFDTLLYMVPPGGTTAESNRGRAVFAGGYISGSPGNGTTGISYFQIQSQGTMIDFGTLSEDRKFSAGLASGTRGVFGGSDGTPSWATGTMEYVTIATTSNTTTFGNMTQAGGMVSAHSNNTRGLFFSVWDANTSGSSHKRHIDYITIATAANSQDFGELTAARPEATGFGSPTRGICSGGYAALSPNAALNTIDYVTIATTGDATDFGDLTNIRQAPGGASSETRGITYAGYANPTQINVVDYVTIASTGNATDFGDSFIAKYGSAAGNCSNKIRAVFAGGKSGTPTWTNSISYVDIATTGNGLDFGDLTATYGYGSVCSDSHGGIS